MIKLELMPQRAALWEGHANTLDVLVQAKAPPSPEKGQPRFPLNISLVLDKSSSMGGRPLDEAKRCAAMVVDLLLPTDRLSLVAYGASPEIIVPSRKVESRMVFKDALSSITAGGMTALHAGWRAGARQVARHIGADRLSRILLLSDGCANVGVRDVKTIAQHCAELAETGVSTSTCGLGEHFNEDLMIGMATSGGGRAHYGQTADDLLDPFLEEMDLLSALCARNLRLSLTPSGGVVCRVLNRYPTNRAGNTLLPDLAYGGEAWAVLRLEIPNDLTAAGSNPVTLLKAGLEYDDLSGSSFETDPAFLRLNPLPLAAYEAVAPDQTVAARSAEVRAAFIQEQARTAARMDDWDQVEHFLNELRSLSVHSPWLQASIRELQRYADSRQSERFSKEALYKSDRMRSRLASLNESSSRWSVDNETALFLRRKREEGRRGDSRDGPSDDSR